MHVSTDPQQTPRHVTLLSLLQPLAASGGRVASMTLFEGYLRHMLQLVFPPTNAISALQSQPWPSSTLSSDAHHTHPFISNYRLQGHVGQVRDQVLEITVPAVWSTLLHGASIPHPYVVEPSPSSFIRARDRPRHSFTLPVLAHLVCPAEKGCGTGYCPSLQLHSLCDAPVAPLPLPAVHVITPDGLLSRPRPLTSSAHPARHF